MYSLMMVGLLASHSVLLGRMRMPAGGEEAVAVLSLLLDLADPAAAAAAAAVVVVEVEEEEEVVVAVGCGRSGMCIIMTVPRSLGNSGSEPEAQEVGGGVGIMAGCFSGLWCFGTFGGAVLEERS